MNLRKWSKQHTVGLLFGILLPLFAVPVVVGLLSLLQGFEFRQMWYMFTINHNIQSKIVSLSILANLGFFYWTINRENYERAMGIILGSILYLPVVLYLIYG